MTARPPLAFIGLWQAVIAAAGGRCQCTGACGRTHAKTEGRCGLEHGGYLRHSGGGTVRLIAAPADPEGLLLPPHKAATLPVQALAAWCPSCHRNALNAALKAHASAAPAAEPDALFEI